MKSRRRRKPSRVRSHHLRMLDPKQFGFKHSVSASVKQSRGSEAAEKPDDGSQIAHGTSQAFQVALIPGNGL